MKNELEALKEYFNANPKAYDAFIAWHDEHNLSELDRAVMEYCRGEPKEKQDDDADAFRAGVCWLSSQWARLQSESTINGYTCRETMADRFNDFIEGGYVW